MSWKVLEGLAVLLYGTLTLVFLFVFSLWHGAFYAGATTILAAAMTYVFQACIVESADENGLVPYSKRRQTNVLLSIVLALSAIAFLLAIFGV